MSKFLISGRFVSYMDTLEQRHHFASYIHELGYGSKPPTICGVPLPEWVDRLRSDPKIVDVYYDVLEGEFFNVTEGETRCPTVTRENPDDWRLGPLKDL